MDIQNTIEEIAKVLRYMFIDKPIIALAGAHAKGLADENSDIDIFIFGNTLRSHADRTQAIAEFCDDPQRCYVSSSFDYPWGGSIDFTYQGIPVEIVVRSLSKTEEIIAQSMDGNFEIIPQTWTANGYYTYIYLSEISFLKPIYDEDGWISKMRQKLENFPPKLKSSIISTFLGRAGTWIGNFHYASAIKRMDTLFIAPIMVHTLMDMVQVIFALNEVYFTGDKKLEKALSELPYCPEKLRANLDFLLKIEKDESILHRQADILTDIYQELCSHA